MPRPAGLSLSPPLLPLLALLPLPLLEEVPAMDMVLALSLCVHRHRSPHPLCPRQPLKTTLTTTQHRMTSSSRCRQR